MARLLRVFVCVLFLLAACSSSDSDDVGQGSSAGAAQSTSTSEASQTTTTTLVETTTTTSTSAEASTTTTSVQPDPASTELASGWVHYRGAAGAEDGEILVIDVNPDGTTWALTRLATEVDGNRFLVFNSCTM